MNMRGRIPMLIGVLAILSVGVGTAQEAPQRPGWLGFAYENPPRTEGDAVRIASIFPGSPAARAGLRTGDVIVRWNGDDDVSGALGDAAMVPGDTVRLQIRRGNQRVRDLAIVVDPRPAMLAFELPAVQRAFSFTPGDTAGVWRAFGGDGDFRELMRGDRRVMSDSVLSELNGRVWREMARADSLRERLPSEWSVRADSLHRGLEFMLRDSLGPRFREFGNSFQWEPAAGARTVFTLGKRSVAGAEFQEMNEQLSTYFGTDRGALVLQVSPGTPAARAGLRAGDVVLEANDRAVRTVEDVRDAVSGAQGRRPRAVELTVLREGRQQELDLRWE